MDTERPLAQEIAYFDAHIGEWLTQHQGRVVLIKGVELVGVYDNESDALSIAARNFGTGPYLIRRVLENQPTYKNVALSLGLLSNASHL